MIVPLDHTVMSVRGPLAPDVTAVYLAAYRYREVGSYCDEW